MAISRGPAQSGQKSKQIRDGLSLETYLSLSSTESQDKATARSTKIRAPSDCAECLVAQQMPYITYMREC